MWAERNARGVDGDPPCDDCKVDLLPCNVIPFRIYLLICGQVRTYFDGERTREIDLDHTSLWMMIDNYPERIVDKWEVFSKVTKAFRHFLNKRNENQG